MESIIIQFIKLVQRFVSGEIDAEQFADLAVDFWIHHDDLRRGSDHATTIISELCLEADALSNQPPYNSTPDELLDMARKALSELLELQTERN